MRSAGLNADAMSLFPMSPVLQKPCEVIEQPALGGVFKSSALVDLYLCFCVQDSLVRLERLSTLLVRLLVSTSRIRIARPKAIVGDRGHILQS
jgi:hypothetical protein